MNRLNGDFTTEIISPSTTNEMDLTKAQNNGEMFDKNDNWEIKYPQGLTMTMKN